MTGQETIRIPTLPAERPPLVPESTPDGSDASEIRLPHSCRCGARWSGTRTAHCAGTCHLTFNGVSPFEDHRRGGACLPPQQVGMSLIPGRPYDCWGYPGNATETEQGDS